MQDGKKGRCLKVSVEAKIGVGQKKIGKTERREKLGNEGQPKVR